jgi:hypothetical protein
MKRYFIGFFGHMLMALMVRTHHRWIVPGTVFASTKLSAKQKEMYQVGMVQELGMLQRFKKEYIARLWFLMALPRFSANKVKRVYNPKNR